MVILLRRDAAGLPPACAPSLPPHPKNLLCLTEPLNPARSFAELGGHNSKSRQKADDHDHDHDFNQRKTRWP
jgi:hypothetical protein